jgi:hypothetical protein
VGAEETALAVGDQLVTNIRPYPARTAFDVYFLLQPHIQSRPRLEAETCFYVINSTSL